MSNVIRGIPEKAWRAHRRDFEDAFEDHSRMISELVRLMVGLLLLKQMYDQSDEDVVERWVENPIGSNFAG